MSKRRAQRAKAPKKTAVIQQQPSRPKQPNEPLQPNENVSELQKEVIDVENGLMYLIFPSIFVNIN